jgi:SAM-dependent methyltransferase
VVDIKQRFPVIQGEYVFDLGSGNGKMLFDLSSKNNNMDIFYVGVEKDQLLYEESVNRIKTSGRNILFVNDDIENVISELEDNAVSMFISCLPHPDYIGPEKVSKWKPFYKKMIMKMKDYGQFLLITECTNELLSPVTPGEYMNWKKWLTFTFKEIGFRIVLSLDNPPAELSSQYLDQFKRDTDRIKILTLLLEK